MPTAAAYWKQVIFPSNQTFHSNGFFHLLSDLKVIRNPKSYRQMFPYGNNKLLHTVKPPISDHFVVLEENLLHAIFKFEMCGFKFW